MHTYICDEKKFKEEYEKAVKFKKEIEEEKEVLLNMVIGLHQHHRFTYYGYPGMEMNLMDGVYSIDEEEEEEELS